MGRVTDWLSEWSLQNKSQWTRSRWIVWENGGTHGHREKFIKVWGKSKRPVLLLDLKEVEFYWSIFWMFQQPCQFHYIIQILLMFSMAKMKQGFKSEPTSSMRMCIYLEWSLWQQHPRAREKGTAYPKSWWGVQPPFVTIIWPHWPDSHTNDIQIILLYNMRQGIQVIPYASL